MHPELARNMLFVEIILTQKAIVLQEYTDPFKKI